MAASVAMLLATAVEAQEAPDPALLERFATFDALRVTAPQEALDLGDGLLAETDDPGLRMTLARTAAQVEEWPRVIAYAEPLTATLPPQDPLLTEALDLLGAAHSALGEAETALGYALRAYNAAESRLGLENPALLARLDALEPRVAALRPIFCPPLRGFARPSRRRSGAAPPRA